MGASRYEQQPRSKRRRRRRRRRKRGGTGQAAVAQTKKRKQSEAEPGAAPEAATVPALKAQAAGGGAPIFATRTGADFSWASFSEGAVITPRSEVNKRFMSARPMPVAIQQQHHHHRHVLAPAPTAAAVAYKDHDAGTFGALPEENNAAVAATARKAQGCLLPLRPSCPSKWENPTTKRR